MSSNIGSSSAHATEQFNILNSAGEDQQRTISLPPQQNPLRAIFRANKTCQQPTQKHAAVWDSLLCGRSGMKAAREALNFSDAPTTLAKCCPCGTKLNVIFVRGTHLLKHCWTGLLSPATGSAQLTNTHPGEKNPSKTFSFFSGKKSFKA